jgi:hypothetical protein
VTYVVTAADSSFQQYTVTVTAAAAATPAGTYYVHAVFSQATKPIIGIASSGTDVYFLHQTSSSSFALEKVDATGTVTSLATTSTATWIDIAVAGNYLFLLQSITSGTTTYSVLRYPLSTFSSPLTLTLPANTAAKKFASDGGGVVYMSGTTATKGIIYFDGNAFTTVSIAKTATVYTGWTYRSGYLYGTWGAAGAGEIDEIPVSSLSATSASPYTAISYPTEIITPNLIKWVPETSSFVITDRNSNGALGATTNGQIYNYVPTFDASTGALSSIGSGTLLIRGNSNSGVGYTETINTTMLPSNTLSTDSSAYLYQAFTIGYNVTASGYVNLFAGNGTSSGAGYLVKFYDSAVGSPIGGL